MTPIIIVCGEAGVGKDAVAASILKQVSGAVSIAQADPIKAFVAEVFGVPSERLWGPSHLRNLPVDGLETPEAWVWVAERLVRLGSKFIESIGLNDPTVEGRPYNLWRWFRGVADKSGVHVSGTSWNMSAHVHGGIKPPTTRHLLQTLGTEYARSIESDVWARRATDTAFRLLNAGGGVAYDREDFRGAVEVSRDLAGPVSLVVITDGRFFNEITNVARVNGHRLLVTGTDFFNKKSMSAEEKQHVSEQQLTQIPAYWYTAHLVNDKSKGFDHLDRVVRSYLDSEVWSVPLYEFPSLREC